MKTPDSLPSSSTSSAQADERRPSKRQYGDRIRRARERANLSQEAVADLIGVSQNVIWKMENNHTKFTVDMLEKLTDVFKTDPVSLLEGDYTRFRIKQTSHDHSTANGGLFIRPILRGSVTCGENWTRPVRTLWLPKMR